MSKNIPTILKKQYSSTLFNGFLIAMLLILPGCGGQLHKKTLNPDKSPSITAEGESIRAKATVAITSSNGKTINGKAVILATTPDLFRIEFLGPFNQTVALLLSDGAGIYFYSRGSAEYHFTGDPDYPYPFTAAEFVTFLLGRSDIAALKERDDYRLKLDSELRIKTLEKLKNGYLLFRASMNDFKMTNERWYPYRIIMEDSTQKIRINYNSIDTGMIIDAELFTSPEKPKRGLPPS